ncbi:FecR domain-containing protein [Porticoccaceae bacterium LTM1]|nr:FecR domain-containing protein [Porticoccaceae bacterium LTM1]
MAKNLSSKYRAARQVARLYSGQLTSDEAVKIAAWTQDEAEYQQDFLDITHGLADMERLADDPDIVEITEAAFADSRMSKRFGQGWAIAALLVLVISGIFSWVQWWPTDVAVSAGLRYVTRVGEQKTVELDDGSVVTLNTGTELQVTMSESKRQLHLKRGEAYFAVSKDALRPFTIDLDGRSVTVLGTEFNIRKTPEKLTIAVLDGEISLHKNGADIVPTALSLSVATGNAAKVKSPQQVRINAGWVAEVDVENDSLVGYASDDIDKYQGWRSGQLRFDEEPLSVVVRELNRYSGKKILIEDAAIMDLKIYAAVRIDRIDLALASLEKTLPIKVIQYFDRTILVGKSVKDNSNR